MWRAIASIATAGLATTLFAACSAPESAEMEGEGLGATSQFVDADALLAAASALGLDCVNPEHQSDRSLGVASSIHCDDSQYGSLRMVVFSSAGVPAAWTDALSLLCVNPLGSTFVAGGNWAVLPTGLLGDDNTRDLATLLNASAKSTCNDQQAARPEMPASNTPVVAGSQLEPQIASYLEELSEMKFRVSCPDEVVVSEGLTIQCRFESDTDGVSGTVPVSLELPETAEGTGLNLVLGDLEFDS